LLHSNGSLRHIIAALDFASQRLLGGLERRKQPERYVKYGLEISLKSQL
jgi:hypothetical protein